MKVGKGRVDRLGGRGFDAVRPTRKYSSDYGKTSSVPCVCSRPALDLERVYIYLDLTLSPGLFVCTAAQFISVNISDGAPSLG